VQLSQTVEYALRAVVWLAERDGEAQTTQEIAAGCRMPASYLAKVMQPLARGGLVVGQRGPRGGFVLARPAGEITVLDVVNSVEPVQRIRSCPLGLNAHGSRLCNLHKVLDGVMERVELAFAEQTIGELLALPNAARPLCPVPREAAPVKIGVKSGR